jgi:hypothetical protein
MSEVSNARGLQRSMGSMLQLPIGWLNGHTSKPLEVTTQGTYTDGRPH